MMFINSRTFCPFVYFKFLTSNFTQKKPESSSTIIKITTKAYRTGLKAIKLQESNKDVSIARTKVNKIIKGIFIFFDFDSNVSVIFGKLRYW